MRKILFISIKFLVTFFILWLLFKDEPVTVFLSKIHEVDANFIFFGILLLFLFNFSVAIRWRVVLRNIGLNYSLSDLSRYTFIGAFFNQVLPTGMSGDVFRVWCLECLALR
jgi:uncharacterized membrane protein YbhN (UPF0104 family)